MARTNNTIVAIASVALLGLSGGLARAQAPAPDGAIGTVATAANKNEVIINQKLNAQVPLDTQLRDENNQKVTFGDFTGKRPIVLVFPFYKCAGSCVLELDDMTRALNALEFTAGKDFDVVVVSIDSNETFTLAQAKKRDYMDVYRRPGSEKGWHFLTGPEESIQQLTQSVGFHFKRDPDTNMISHPIGLMILTPEGRVSHYLFGLDFSPRDIKLALVDASDHKIGSLSDYAALLCSHYDAATGKYGVAISKIIKYACGGTVLILGSFIFAMFRMEKRRNELHRAGADQSAPPDTGHTV